MVEKKEINTYSSQHSVLSAMFENHEKTKPSSKECIMKFSKVHSTAKTFESCKQAGIDNRSSQIILEFGVFL